MLGRITILCPPSHSSFPHHLGNDGVGWAFCWQSQARGRNEIVFDRYDKGPVDENVQGFIKYLLSLVGLYHIVHQTYIAYIARWKFSLNISHLNCYSSDWWSWGHWFDPCWIRQHSFTDHHKMLYSLPSHWFKKGICLFLAKEYAQILVRGLSLPWKCVVR